MMQLFKHRWNRISVRIAVASFITGTLLMLMALMAKNGLIVTIGLTFLVVYVPVTLITLFVMVGHAIINYKDMQEHIMTAIIVLMNLPIALLYINFINY